MDLRADGAQIGVFRVAADVARKGVVTCMNHNLMNPLGLSAMSQQKVRQRAG
jgi:hypothetical protein